MSLLIGFLTFILVVNCLFLMLLVLVQLPKKEAGSGLAFGAGAVDTLIGAGSGNALTKMTKYTAGTFLGLAIVLAMLNSQRHGGSTLQEELSRKASAAPALPSIPPPVSAPSSGTLNSALPTDATTTARQPTTTEGAAPIELNLQSTPTPPPDE